MKQVIFYINKSTGKFRQYQIINGELAELKKAVETYVLKPDCTDDVIIVEDQHVIDAICQRESRETMRGFLEDIKEAQKEVENAVRDFHGSIERSIDDLHEMLEEEAKR